MQDQEQIEQLRSVCKLAVRDAMEAAHFAQYTELQQIEMKANISFSQAEGVTMDFDTFKKTFITAFETTQKELILKPGPYSSTVQPSQILENMRFTMRYQGGFDAAYSQVSAKVESSVGISQTEEQESEEVPQ